MRVGRRGPPPPPPPLPPTHITGNRFSAPAHHCPLAATPCHCWTLYLLKTTFFCSFFFFWCSCRMEIIKTIEDWFVQVSFGFHRSKDKSARVCARRQQHSSGCVPSRRRGLGGAVRCAALGEPRVNSVEARSSFTAPSSAGPHREDIWQLCSSTFEGRYATFFFFFPFLFSLSTSTRRRLSSAKSHVDVPWRARTGFLFESFGACFCASIRHKRRLFSRACDFRFFWRKELVFFFFCLFALFLFFLFF